MIVDADPTTHRATVAKGEGRQGPWTLAHLTDAERQLLDRLYQLYLYDFSELDHADVEEDGLWHDIELDPYGREPGHHALLLRVNGKPAGFALIDEESPLADGAGFHYIHEFHVLRAYRHGGYGTAMAWAVFDFVPGRWQIEQIGPNIGAQAFWRRAIDRYTAGRFTERTYQGRRFHLVVQEFDTSDRVAL